MSAILGMRPADGLPSGSCTVWALGSAMTRCSGIVRFARPFNRNFEAVKNAVEMRWSNGQAVARINSLKTLHRAIYGRAGPELRRARILPVRHTH